VTRRRRRNGRRPSASSERVPGSGTTETVPVLSRELVSQLLPLERVGRRVSAVDKEVFFMDWMREVDAWL